MCLIIPAMLFCCDLRLISCLKCLRGCHAIELMGVRAVFVWTFVIQCCYCEPEFPSRKKKQKKKRVYLNDLNLLDVEDHWLVCYFTLCQLWLWSKASDGSSVFPLCLPLLLITWCGWCGGVDWELQSTLFTNSWLSRLAGLQHQGTPTPANTQSPLHTWHVSLSLAEELSQANQRFSSRRSCVEDEEDSCCAAQVTT